MFAQARITQGALYILFVCAGLSFVYLLGGDEVRARMGSLMVATGYSLWGEFKLWQLATSPLVEIEFISLLFQGFALWMFLPALERWWGMKRFLTFAAVTSVVGVVAGSLVGRAAGRRLRRWSRWPGSIRSCSAASWRTGSCSRTSRCSSSASCP